MYTNIFCKSRRLDQSFLSATIKRSIVTFMACWVPMVVAIESEQTTEQQFQSELDHWTLQAYEGDRDAQFKVGVLYSNNQFREADYEQAVYWYKQAARQGHALSQYNLGHQYIIGEGVGRNESEAMNWWLKAANQDHPLAQFNLGRGFYLGIGVDKNHERAQFWFRRAATNNEPKSIDILNLLGWAKEGEFTAPEKAVAVSPETKNESNIKPISKAVVAKALVEKPVTEKRSAEKPAVAKPIKADNDAKTTNAVAAKPNSSSTANNEIAIYTNPNKRPVLISMLDDLQSLKVVEQSGQWARVRSNIGFPVWVHEDFISVNGNKGTINGVNVNARSVPLITEGSLVGKLRKGSEVVVLDSKDQWRRVQSPPTFNAWVKTNDLSGRQLAGSSQSNAKTDERSTAKKPVPQTATENTRRYANNNEWLFNQPEDHYTLQLASFDDPAKVTEFESHDKFKNNSNLYRFNSNSKEIEWTYFLYGSFADSETAKSERNQINQKLAWVRTFGRIQQNRCLAWKKQIPTPKALNKYCS